MDVPENITISDRMCTAIESTAYHKDVLCQEYKAPLGYYFECVDQTNSQFSCRSTCGPSIDSIGTGPEFDLLNQGGGLLLGKEANKGNLFDFSNFKNGGALDFGLSGIGKNTFAQNGGRSNGIDTTSNNGNSRFQTNNVGTGSSSSSSSSSTSDGGKLSSNIFGQDLFGNQGLNNNVFTSNDGKGYNNLNRFNRPNNNANNVNINSANIFQFENPFVSPKPSQGNPGFFKNPFDGASSFGTPDSFRRPRNSGILDRRPESRPLSDPFKNGRPADRFDRDKESGGPVHGKRDTDFKYPEITDTKKDGPDTNGPFDPQTNLQRPGNNPGIQIDVSPPSNLEIVPDKSQINVRESKDGGYRGSERGIAVGEPYPGSFPDDTQQEGDNRESKQRKPQKLPESGPFAPGKSDIDPFIDSNRDISSSPAKNENFDTDAANTFIGKVPPTLPDSGISRPKESNVNQDSKTGIYPDDEGDNVIPSVNDQYSLDTARTYPPKPAVNVYPAGNDIYIPDDMRNFKHGNDQHNSYPRDVSQSSPQRDQNLPALPQPSAQNQYVDIDNTDRHLDVTRGRNNQNPPFTNHPTNQNSVSNNVSSKKGSGIGDSSRLGGVGEKEVKPPAGLDGSRLKGKYQPEENVNFDGTSLLADSDYLDRPGKERFRGKIPKEFEKPFQAESNIFPGFNDFANGNAASSAFGTGESVFNLFKDKESSPPGFRNGDFNFNNKEFLKPDDYLQGKPPPGSQPQQGRVPTPRPEQPNYPRQPPFSSGRNKENPGRTSGFQDFRPGPRYNNQEHPSYNPASDAVGMQNPSVHNGQDYLPKQPPYPAKGNTPLYPPGARYNPLPSQRPVNGYRERGPPEFPPPSESYQPLPGGRNPQRFVTPSRPPFAVPGHPGNANQKAIPVYTTAPSGIRGNLGAYPSSTIDPTSGQSYPVDGPPYGFRPLPANPNGPVSPSPTNIHQFQPNDKYNGYPRTHPSSPPYYGQSPSSGPPPNSFSNNGYPVNPQNAPLLYSGDRNRNAPPSRVLNSPVPGYDVASSSYPPTPAIDRAGIPPSIPRGAFPNNPRVIPSNGYNSGPNPNQSPHSYPSYPLSVPLGVSPPGEENVYQYNPTSKINAPENARPYVTANNYPNTAHPLRSIEESRSPTSPFPGPPRAQAAPRSTSPISGRGYDPYYKSRSDNTNARYQPSPIDSAQDRGFDPQLEAPRSPDRRPRPSGEEGDDNSRFTPKALLDASPFSFDDPVRSFEPPNTAARDSGGGLHQKYEPSGGSFVPTKPFFAPAASQPQTTSDDRDAFGRRQPGDGKFDESFASDKFKDPDGYFGDSAFTEDTTTENTEKTSSRNETQDLAS